MRTTWNPCHHPLILDPKLEERLPISKIKKKSLQYSLSTQRSIEKRKYLPILRIVKSNGAVNLAKNEYNVESVSTYTDSRL